MINFDNSYSKLPENFYRRIDKTNDYDPTLIAFNHDLATQLGLDLSDVDEKTLAKYFSASLFMPGSSPLAMAYAGHQFGHFVPQLGDGRAMLLGEFISNDKKHYDIHLKGSGRTHYSRAGDGKSALGPVLREYLVSEGMNALGVPTTRTLCAVRTGEWVQRDSLYPEAVLTRIALGHIRIGTFQYFAARQDWKNLQILTEYSISRLYPELLSSPEPILDFWRAVAHRQMKLVAKWMSLGFIHGVMNTDNMAISGETIDYGPCAFMDNFILDNVFSSIDRNGRYSYSNQPKIALWNLARLAECLVPLIKKEQKMLEEFFTEEIDNAYKLFLQEHNRLMMSKFGLHQVSAGDSNSPDDQNLISQWLQLLEANSLDFTLSYIDLERILAGKNTFSGLETVTGFEHFFKGWKGRLDSEGKNLNDTIHKMTVTNPLTIPRNHHVQRVIELSEKGDDQEFFNMLNTITHPFERFEELGKFQQSPKVDQRILETFCGT